jgi:hypothetical protein
MAPSPILRQTPGCAITRESSWLRATVGPGLADEVQECYRALANECLRGECHRVLVLGIAKFDPSAHLAGRDALRSLAIAGVAEDFRLALVALTPDLIAIYDVAVLEAERLGINARRFMAEEDAKLWLSA